MRAVCLSAALLFVAACHKHRDAEGPGESAGRGIDNAAQKTGDALHRAAVKTDEAARKAVHATGNAFERAGNKLQGAPGATQPQNAPKPASDAKPSESK